MAGNDRSPYVTVLMSAYNAEPFVHEAVDSILRQTWTDFEFVIVDNASSDRTCEIIERFGDTRIRLIRNAANLGPPAALNIGLRHAHGEFVARMDADDVARADRLSVQVAYLQSHQNVAVAGTQRCTLNRTGARLPCSAMPRTVDEIRWKLLFTSPLCHSSVMVRRNSLESIGGYNESLRHAADYDLWSRLVRGGCTVANVDEELMGLRVYPESDGMRANREQIAAEAAEVSRANLAYFFHLDVSRAQITPMIQLLLEWEAGGTARDTLPAVATIRRIADRLDRGTGGFAGRTLVRLAVLRHDIPVATRAVLFVRGIHLMSMAGHIREFLRSGLDRLRSGRRKAEAVSAAWR
jgi:glycosyltransferase involved in cell wall biosynthesis